jgi:hypothetical protein
MKNYRYAIISFLLGSLLAVWQPPFALLLGPAPFPLFIVWFLFLTYKLIEVLSLYFAKKDVVLLKTKFQSLCWILCMPIFFFIGMAVFSALVPYYRAWKHR